MDGARTRTAFSEHVTTDAWLDDARAWLTARAADAGRPVTGESEQRYARPWSTQLVAPTADGPLYFKANCPSMAFEPALHALLADVAPDLVAAPLAVDTERGWMLTADRGPTLGDARRPTSDDWRGVLTSAAALQRRVVDHRADVLATGVPDCSPATVPDRLDRLVGTLRALPVEHPSHLSDDDASRVLARRPDVVAAAQVLEGSALPVSLQHGDLHPWNAFADLSVFDFGDVQWAHAAEVLGVPWRIVAETDGVEWDDVVGAWTDVWDTAPVDVDAWRGIFAAATLTEAVNRAQTWWDSLASASDAELADLGEAPRLHLLRVLEP